MSELIALIDGEPIATLTFTNGRTALAYEKTWQEATHAYPLSLSMPLAARRHPPQAVEPFLWGLLPDNELVLERWARQFQVSARNAFALISHVGEDCAGAVQFVRPEKVEELRRDGGIIWLSQDELRERLQILREDAAAGRRARDHGQFSLAGAQPKTALLRDGERWGIPSGRIPTTHILKPTTQAFAGHAENEHLCLAVAEALGLVSARSEVIRFGDVTAIAVERYDRDMGDDGLPVRIHQEDMCQALRVHPASKYQNEGGPGASKIADAIRTFVYQPLFAGETVGDTANEDLWRFIDALLFNWLIGGTDAHAKNYSLLIASEGLVRLAPLYDLASIFAYPEIDIRDAKLAMHVGGRYRLSEIGLRRWRAMAADLRVDEDALVARAKSLGQRLPDCFSDQAARMRAEGLDHPIIDNMLSGIARHVRLAMVEV
ncbi:type II toxin-antitoxin system HipA family toxin [Allosphingosinicella flava]|uniref:Type II toxin-antitoxin system HipA family toxin n=1 Tax=Allosphingosinicella flava TaxID=2771430 RepID=A0A7T2GIA7_9SPHN|nr:type II toxin-antitoxin system HipA family toxin [Sphingosinicella flava]QPQ54048.1 type II toxin-antitoxin system HipA family toxin [Sphingosinicella flava]